MEPNKKFWIGKTSDDLASHPVYASLPVESRKTESGIETRTFRNSSGIVSSASCSSYSQYGSSCGGIASEVVCTHVFLLKKGIISDLNRAGSCGDEDLKFRPLDNNGNPLVSDFEVQQIKDYYGDRGPAAGEVAKRDCSIFGKLLRSQGCY
jgi:hypothetical protein